MGGLGAQAFGQVVNTVIQIASVPLFLRAWGIELYADWLIVSAVPVYLAMSDVGFTNAAMNDMTMSVGKGDRAAALASCHSAWLLLSLVTVGAVIVIVPTVLLLPIGTWLKLSRLEGPGPVMILLSIQVLANLQTGLVYAGFHCERNYGIGQFLVACVRLSEFGAMAVTVLLGGGPFAAAMAFVGARIVGTLGMRIVLWRRSPWLSFGYRYASKRVVKRLAGPAFAFTAFPLGNALSLQGVLIVVGSTLGPVPTVTFNTLRTMTRVGLQFVNAIRAAVAAEVSTAFSAGNYALLRQLHDRSCQAALWVSAAVVVGLLVFGEKILFVWTHGSVGMDRLVFILLLSLVLPASLWLSSLNLAYATNRHERVGAAYVGISLVTVLGTYGVASRLHLPGIAGILLIGECFMVLYVVRTSLSLLNETPGDFARALVLSRGLAWPRRSI